MNTSSYLKYSAVLLPVLALGMPMAHAVESGTQSDQQRTTTQDRSRQHQGAQAGYLDAVPARGFHSDTLMGKDILNRRNNETVGQVSNLVLDEDGQVVAVILSIGGLLGFGERDVALEWDQIERRVDGDDIALSVDLPEDSLENAPDYVTDRSDRHDRSNRHDRSDQADRRTGMLGTSREGQQQTPRADQRSNQRDQYGLHDDQRDQQASQRDEHASQRDQQYGTGDRMGQQFVENKPARGFHSDNLVGKEVKSRHNDESIGKISNLVIDGDGQVLAAIVSVGGLMGIGARDVAISWDQIETRVEGDDVTLWVDLTEQNMKDAPKYSSDRQDSRSDRGSSRRSQ